MLKRIDYLEMLNSPSFYIKTLSHCIWNACTVTPNATYGLSVVTNRVQHNFCSAPSIIGKAI